ncbi:hypothetical protein VNO77_42470 [Canavalia gladiata]|uniref:Uncharacterized protein n=1 Tax=Canavalia gladiata TaxID=3824 RepID=A0AAN9JSV8_CANGL
MMIYAELSFMSFYPFEYLKGVLFVRSYLCILFLCVIIPVNYSPQFHNPMERRSSSMLLNPIPHCTSLSFKFPTPN